MVSSSSASRSRTSEYGLYEHPEVVPQQVSRGFTSRLTATSDEDGSKPVSSMGKTPIVRIETGEEARWAVACCEWTKADVDVLERTGRAGIEKEGERGEAASC